MTNHRPWPVAAPCVRGCTTIRHVAGCSCTDDGHEHTEPHHPHADGDLCVGECRWCDECDGCEPVPSYLGRVVDGRLTGLCRADVGRIERDLLDVAPLVLWVRDHLPRGSAPDGPKVRGTKEPPAPVTVAAVDDVDDLLALLWSWTVDTMQAENLAGPSVAGIRIRPQQRAQAQRYVDEDGEHRGGEVVYRDAQVVGLRAGADPEHTALAVVSWLATHLEAIAGGPGAADFHDEITRAVRRLQHAWPLADQTSKLPLPCPDCDLQLLYLHPPPGPPARDEHGQLLWAHANTVACHNDDCGRTMRVDDYYLAAQTAAAERTGRGRQIPRQPRHRWADVDRQAGAGGRP